MTNHKPTVRKIKDVKGRRILGYVAEYAYESGLSTPTSLCNADPYIKGDRCKTPAAAVASWHTVVAAALDRLATGTSTIEQHGEIGIIAPTLHGWSYRVPGLFGDMVYGDYHTQSEAEEHCRYHMAQTQWTLEIDDETYLTGLPEHLRAKLRDYFDWQRKYAYLVGQHIDRALAHRIAGQDPTLTQDQRALLDGYTAG